MMRPKDYSHKLTIGADTFAAQNLQVCAFSHIREREKTVKVQNRK